MVSNFYLQSQQRYQRQHTKLDHKSSPRLFLVISQTMVMTKLIYQSFVTLVDRLKMNADVSVQIVLPTPECLSTIILIEYVSQ